MRLHMLLALSVMAMLPAVSEPQAQPKTGIDRSDPAIRAGLRSAKRKGIEAGPKRQCYARVYAANAHRNQDGKWRTTGRGFAPAMWNECGIHY